MPRDGETIRLGDMRRAVGLTQAQLAERLGTSQGRVATIEKSHNQTRQVLRRYLEAIGAELHVAAVFRDSMGNITKTLYVDGRRDSEEA